MVSDTFLPFCQKLGGNNNGIENCRNGTGNGSHLTPQTDQCHIQKGRVR